MPAYMVLGYVLVAHRLLTIMPVDSKPTKLRVISHRCLGFGLPENSASALQAALASSVDEVEVDFRITRDGNLVASHFDLFFDRRGLPRLVSWGDLHTHQEHGLMTLEQCLTLFERQGGGKRLRLEIKSQGVEQQVFDAIARAGLTDRVVLVSWNAGALRRFRTLSSAIELSLSYIMGLHGSGTLPFALPTELPAVLDDVTVGVRSVNIIRGLIGITPEYVAKLTSRGIEVFVTSRGGDQEVEKLRDLGVTGALFSSFKGVLVNTGITAAV